MFSLNFDRSYGASSPQSGPSPMQLLAVFALKKALRGWQFCSDRELLTVTQTFFNPLLESQFCKTFEDKWSERMQKCILSRGHYFEKDWSKNEDVSSDSKYNFLITFSFENCGRGRRSRLYVTSRILYVIHHR